MNCVFEPDPTDATKLACKHKCGVKIPARLAGYRVLSECSSQQQSASMPSVAARMSNYAKARRKWRKAGKPMRGNEQINSIMEVCRGCEHFVKTEDDTNGCRTCGCQKLIGIGGLRTKISWATESCPLDPPKWQSEISRDL